MQRCFGFFIGGGSSILLERESVHSCTEKAFDYWRIAAIAASTPI
jgi:hypothetical protein